MSEHLIFESVGGVVLPCLPHNADGSPREIDNARYLDLVAAAQRWGIDEANAREIYGLYLNDLMGASRGLSAASTALRDRYSHLSEEHFQQYLDRCRRLRFDPAGRHIWPRTRWNDATGAEELSVELTADGFYAVAMRSGDLSSIIGPEWCGPDHVWSDVWSGDGPPTAARVSVLRRGMAEPIVMVADWNSYAPFKFISRGKKEYDKFWLKMPAFMIGKCAASLAIRRAYAEQLDGIYGPEEMAQAQNPKPATIVATSFVPDAPIETRAQFELALIELGLGRKAVRNEAIELFRERYQLMYTRDLCGWYKAVVNEVRRNPVAYGAVVELQQA